MPQQDTSLIRLDQFRADPHFAGINGSGETVVVIDTGIDLNHPFFGPDANHNGIDDRIVYSYDFSGSNDSNASDTIGHGSNVASIIGSQDPTYTGMAPGCNIVVLKVFPDFSGFASNADIKEALDWVVANRTAYNIVSVNLSLGDVSNNNSPTPSVFSSEFAALASNNCVVAVASGNEYAPSEFQSQGVSSPSSDPNAWSIGAVWDRNAGGPYGWGNGPFGSLGSIDYTTGPDVITSFSQRSTTMTTVFAPGGMITGANYNGGTVTYSGTSQAAPHIAGLVADMQQLAFQVSGHLMSTADLRTTMRASADPIVDSAGHDNVAHSGATYLRVDAEAWGLAILNLLFAGTPGNDTLNGTPADDVINGGAGNDTLSGGGGNDTLIGGSGNNTLNGGLGTDTVDYSSAPGAVTVSLASGTASNGYGGTDTLSSIEAVIGSSHDDTLTAGSGAATLSGGAGNDTLVAGTGSVTMTGGSGRNTFDFTPGDGAATVTDFKAGSGGDTLSFSGLGATALQITTASSGSSSAGLVFRNQSTGQVAVDVTNGSGGLQSQRVLYATSSAGLQLAGIGDLNGDGSPDVLWRDPTTGRMDVDFFTGSSVSSTANIYPSRDPSIRQFAGIGDFDGDGKADLLWINPQTGQTILTLMSGAAQIGGGVIYDARPGAAISGVGDFDGDGKSDVLWRFDDGHMTIVFMNGFSVVTGGTAYTNVASTMQVIGTGDLNGDGKSDIIWEDMTTGNVSADLMNGTTVIGHQQLVTGLSSTLRFAGVSPLTGLQLAYGGSTIALNGASTSSLSLYDNLVGASTVSFANATAGITANLATAGAGDGQIHPTTVIGSTHNDTLIAGIDNETLEGGGGNDTYRFSRGTGQDVVVNGLPANTGPTGEIDFGAGIATNQLWLKQSGSDLVAEIMGTHDQVTVTNWFGAASSQVQEITTADGSKLDSQLSQLVQAMATYGAANPGFDPTVATQVPGDPTLQSVLAAAWHH